MNTGVYSKIHIILMPTYSKSKEKSNLDIDVSVRSISLTIKDLPIY